jgi:hypothetical protein
MYALKIVAGMGLLLGHPVMAHLSMPSSMPAQWQNLSILFICGCMCQGCLIGRIRGKDVVEGRDGRTDVSDSYRTYSCKNGFTSPDSFLHFTPC